MVKIKGKYSADDAKTDEQFFLPWLVVDRPRSDGEWPMRCPLPDHPDSNASASINFDKGLFHCQVCDRGSTVDALRTELTGVVAPMATVTNISDRRSTTAQGTAGADPISETKVERFHASLMEQSDKLADFCERRGLTIETVERFKIGWESARKRYVIPVYDEHGAIRNLRKYEPGGDPTMKSETDHGSPARLYPISQLDRDGTVFITEGELDALRLIQEGFIAVSGTGGAKTWPKNVGGQFKGCEVVVLYDNDDAGRVGAEKVRSALAGHAASVKVCTDLSDEPGGDVTDWFAAGGTVEQFVERIEALPTVEADGASTDTKRRHVTGFELNDTGMALRMVANFGDNFRYCHAWGKWYVWNGRYFAPDDVGSMIEYADKTARLLHAEAAEAGDSSEREPLSKAAHSYSQITKQKHMVEAARSKPGVPVRPHELNADPWLLCVENGTIDLHTGDLRPHDPSDLITLMAPTAYDPNAPRGEWSKFIRQVTGGNKALAAFLQRLAYAALIGEVLDKAFAFLHGPRDTGKTTFLELLKAVLGEYAGAVDGSVFLQQTMDRIPDGLSKMDGKRLVISNEMGKGKMNAQLVQKLSGGDTMTFEAKYKTSWESIPSFTIIMAGNSVPEALMEDDAIWSRWREVPFLTKIPKAEGDWKAKAVANPAIRAEVLAWAMRGREGYQRDGIGTAPVIEVATAARREAMDPIRGFWNDKCRFATGLVTKKATMRGAYERWCELNGSRAVGDKAFKQIICDRIDKAGSGRVADDGQPRFEGTVEKARVWFGVGPKEAT